MAPRSGLSPSQIRFDAERDGGRSESEAGGRRRGADVVDSASVAATGLRGEHFAWKCLRKIYGERLDAVATWRSSARLAVFPDLGTMNMSDK